jgi:hypothetical protein
VRPDDVKHIDLSSVLRGAVCDLYSNLVTRPTGAAVRNAIEQQLAESPTPVLTVLDFSHVNLLDFSCADEIVAKLLLRHSRADEDGLPPAPGYFVVRGISDMHLDAIEAVLERHDLALVAMLDGEIQIVGRIGDGERRAWEAICRLGRAAPLELASTLGTDVDETLRLLEQLAQRRLVMRIEEGFVAVNVAA